MTHSVLDNLLMSVPFIVAMSIGVFRAEDRLFAPQGKPRRARRNFCGPESAGRLVITDPDGRDPRRRTRRPPIFLNPAAPRIGQPIPNPRSETKPPSSACSL